MKDPRQSLAPWLLVAGALVCFGLRPALGGEAGRALPTIDELERAGAIVENVIFERRDIFDTNLPDEDKFLYRLANRLHVTTRQSTIRSQLLFRAGEPVDAHRIAESERLLRRNSFLAEATIRPTALNDGKVDLTVFTRDNWTLFPKLDYTRGGGERESTIGIEDSNFLGTGSRLVLSREEDVERTSTVFEFTDRNVGRTWIRLDLALANADDGDRQLFAVERPFYALDARWAAGTRLGAFDRVETLYSDGDDAAEFRHDQRHFDAYYGWSAGLAGGWVRRWTAGVVFDDNEFQPEVVPGLVAVAPDDRKLVYPYVGIEVIEDRYATTTNFNQIVRTEDVFLGRAWSARLGWAGTSIGADRDALVFKAAFSDSFGSPEATLWRLSSGISGRLESGNLENARLDARAEYYRRQSKRRTLYAKLDVVAGHDLDREIEVGLGRETGLRGFPFRHRNGDSRALFSIEQRYFSDRYPLRLFRVGGALFFDAGRTWGRDVTGRNDDRWLTNAGFGLRLSSPRVGGDRVLHLDVAFPLNGDSTIDDVQVSVDGRRRF